MENWFYLAVLAAVLYGLFGFLYKTAAHRGIDSVAVVNISTATVFALSLITFLARGPSPGNPRLLVLLALANGTFFLLGSVSQLEALRFVPSSIAFPLGKMNVLYILLIAVFIFGERPGGLQLLGVAAAVAMIFTARKKPPGKEAQERHARGFVLALLAGLFTAVSVSFGRVAARSPVDRLAYVTLSYGLVALLSYGWNRGVRKGRYRVTSACLLIGAGAGALNFFGYLLVLQAFASGPLSLVHPIFSMSIIIPIALSVAVYREPFTRRNLAAVLLCLLAVFLLRQG